MARVRCRHVARAPELDTTLFVSAPASMKVRATGTPVFVRGQVSAPAFALRQHLSYDSGAPLAGEAHFDNVLFDAKWSRGNR